MRLVFSFGEEKTAWSLERAEVGVNEGLCRRGMNPHGNMWGSGGAWSNALCQEKARVEDGG